MLRKIVLATAVLSLAAMVHGQDPAKARKAPARAYVKAAPAGQEENLVRVLRTSNKAQTNRYVCETYEFKNINPFNVINFFWAVTSREVGGIYSFVNPGGTPGEPTGTTGFLTVICPEYQLATLRDLARELDRPQLTSAPGSKYIYYRMKHRNISNPSFLRVLQYYTGTGVAGAPGVFGSSGATSVVWPDVETNSVLLYDAPKGADETAKALDTILDLPLQQVELAVKIFEVNANNNGTLGLDYESWKNGPGKLLGLFRARGQYARVGGSSHSHFHTSGAGVYLDYPSAFFDFLVEKGHAKSVVNTKVTAINRVPALVQTGEQIPFYQVTEGSNGRELRASTTAATLGSLAFPSNSRVISGGNLRSPFRRTSLDGQNPLSQAPQDQRAISSTVDAVDTGISFAVVPTLGKEMVNMDLNLKVVNNTGYDDAGQPLLASRQLTDSIAVALGDEVIFGGLAREQRVQSTRKIPFFGSLPGIGYLFGGETTVARKTYVVAAISPRAVTGGNNVTEKDNQIVKNTGENEVVVLPASEFCFEQSVPFIH